MVDIRRRGRRPIFTLLEINGVPALIGVPGLFLFILMFVLPISAAAQTNVLTYHNDNGRTGQNVNETLLTPGNVNVANFGRVGFLPVDGRVIGQPLYVSNLPVAGTPHNVVFVVTEHHSVYAFDADSLTQLWSVTLLGRDETSSNDPGCVQISPEVGISSTPVIDLDAGTAGAIYVVAMSTDASGNYHRRLHALSLVAGNELPNSPANIEGTGLLLSNGVVYVSAASQCGTNPGPIIGYSVSTLEPVTAFDFTPNVSGDSARMRGAGLSADILGNVYQALGSGGALILPDLVDALEKTRRLAVAGGKDGAIYIVDRDSIPTINPSNTIQQDVATGNLSQDVWGMPAYFNGTIYYGAVDDSLTAFPIVSARLASPVSKTERTFGYPGATPSISANGASNGIVWAVRDSGGMGVLQAYDATNLASELYNSDEASARDEFLYTEFATPTIANGQVYVGTPTGVIVFGLLQNPPTPSSIEVTSADASISLGAMEVFPSLALDATATTAYVQSASGNDHWGTASASAPFAANVTAGNAIAVLCAWTSVSQTLTSVTDSQGNSYTLVDNPTTGSYGRAAMAYAIAQTSGPMTVACRFSSAAMGKSVIVHEISGVNASVPLDGHKMTVRMNPGTGANALTSGSITTTVSGDYLVGFTFNDSGNLADWNAGTGFTRRQDLRIASYPAASEDMIQAAPGAVAATFTATTGTIGEFITGILAFRPR
jgi:hypothetical protein